MPDKMPKKQTSLKRFPWKPLLAGIGAVGAGYGLGHLGSGIVTKGMERSPLVGEAWRRLTPSQQKSYSRLIGAGAGGGAALAATAAHAATQANLLDYMRRREMKQKKTESEKVASAYQEALRRMDE